MDQGLVLLAVDLEIDQRHFVDAVIVPFVMGRHLVDPLGNAGVGVTGEDGHRPLVVAGALLGVPGRGVARTVIDQVQLGIIGIPAPGAATAGLPLVALPGLDAGILPDRLAEFGGLFRVDQHFLVGAHGIGAPSLLAGFQVIGGDMATHAEFTTGNADDQLVLDGHDGGGVGFALFGIAIDDGPDHLAGLGVERHHRGVGLMQEHLAVGISQTAIDGVATHHGNDVGILFGIVTPDDLAFIVEIEGKDGVGKRRMDIHDVADHERGPFMAAQDARRESPGDLEFLDVFRGNLVELRISCVRIVAGLQHPLVGILRQLLDFVVGIGLHAEEQRADHA